jgi:hypothetical protein
MSILACLLWNWVRFAGTENPSELGVELMVSGLIDDAKWWLEGECEYLRQFSAAHRSEDSGSKGG